MNIPAPDHTTHTPIKVVIPTEDDLVLERERLETPSIWQEGVQVTHKQDPDRKGVVRRVEYTTRQFRLVGQPRTSWESFDNWNVLVEKTAAEKAKDAARIELEEELAALDADDLAAVQVLCDDDDATKALAKFNAMKRLGIIGKKGQRK